MSEDYGRDRPVLLMQDKFHNFFYSRYDQDEYCEATLLEPRHIESWYWGKMGLSLADNTS